MSSNPNLVASSEDGVIEGDWAMDSDSMRSRRFHDDDIDSQENDEWGRRGLRDRKRWVIPKT